MPNVLITGATSGLGFELAKLYQNSHLILLGRKPKPELDIFQTHLYIQCDLAQPNATEIVLEQLKDRDINSLDLLIHNAALGYYGDTGTQNNANISELLQVNLYAPIAITHALMPLLKHAKGKVVFISSVAANLPAPDYAVYSASKAALSGFARNLRIEATVEVQTIYPGAIQTNFHSKSGVPIGKFNASKFPTALDTAEAIHRAVQGTKHNVTIGLGNTLARAAGRYLSGTVDSVMRNRQ
jgi:short-subunit dehydrogenase